MGQPTPQAREAPWKDQWRATNSCGPEEEVALEVHAMGPVAAGKRPATEPLQLE